MPELCAPTSSSLVSPYGVLHSASQLRLSALAGLVHASIARGIIGLGFPVFRCINHRIAYYFKTVFFLRMQFSITGGSRALHFRNNTFHLFIFWFCLLRFQSRCFIIIHLAFSFILIFKTFLIIFGTPICFQSFRSSLFLFI